MAVIKNNATRAMCVALCFLVIVSSALSDDLVEFKKECSDMDPCTVNKCKLECIAKAKKQDYPYPVKQNCDTGKECCCRFYKEEHSPPSSRVATTAAEDDVGFLV